METCIGMKCTLLFQFLVGALKQREKILFLLEMNPNVPLTSVRQTNNLEAGVSNFLQYWGLLFKLRPFSRVISEIYLKTQFGPNSLLPCSSNAVVRSVPNMNQVTALHLNTWLENCMQFLEFFEKMYKNECWAKLQFLFATYSTRLLH